MENVIRSIDPGSPLEKRAAVGDRLLSINGKRILDVLDYKFYAYDRPTTVICICSSPVRTERNTGCTFTSRKAEISVWILKAI